LNRRLQQESDNAIIINLNKNHEVSFPLTGN
jgi:hypothetical protein